MTEGNKNKEKVRKSEAQSRGSDIQLVGIPEKEIMKEEGDSFLKICLLPAEWKGNS